jgi:hypothetical protein
MRHGNYRVSATKVGQCLISCNVKAIKYIAMKRRSLHLERTNLDFDI